MASKYMGFRINLNAYGLGFGPINVDLYRISGLLEVGDYERLSVSLRA